MHFTSHLQQFLRITRYNHMAAYMVFHHGCECYIQITHPLVVTIIHLNDSIYLDFFGLDVLIQAHAVYSVSKFTRFILEI